MTRPVTGFSVDTHLLRELGELLVGRDSTAVLELIKNAYDADAEVVTLEATGLSDGSGRIVVVDDGNGMTAERFRTAFMRIAGREKEAGQRRSPRYGRRYTGQKGIGRLATHKLAAWLRVTSVPRESGDAVEAVLDWDKIEEQHSLDDLRDGLDVQPFQSRPGQPHGTSFELQRLRRPSWTAGQRALFVDEVRSTQPPQALLDPEWPLDQRTAPSMLRTLRWRETRSGDPGFRVELTGDFDAGDDLWERAAERFNWVVEIDATTDLVEYEVSPLVQYSVDEPEARTYRFRRTSSAAERPRFQARIFVMGRATGRGPLGGFARARGGIRVYLEGFRVLPYGEYGNDWLRIARDYRVGDRRFRIVLDDDSDEVVADAREGLNALLNESYFGAVFLTETGATGLRSLVNREGFVPDESFDSLVDLVRAGVDLSVRVRRAVLLAQQDRVASEKVAAEQRRLAEQEQARRRARADDESGKPNDDDWPGEGDATPPEAGHGGSAPSRPAEDPSPSEIVEGARQAAGRLRTSTVPSFARGDVELMLSGFSVADAELDRLRSLQGDLRVLAGVGLQLGAFVHDINGMLGQASTVRELISTVLDDPGLTAKQRARLLRVDRGIFELTHSLTRQSSYLTDVLVADPRRRRSRIRVTERMDPVERLLAGQLGRRDITFENAVPDDVKTPPMFPAEVSVLLTNLLTNAVKNAGSPGRVRVEGSTLGQGGATLLVNNTGTPVDLDESERWFRPFESTTTEIDDVLGQGLGLGLPISRALVEDYRGTIAFVTPPPGFSTSIRVDLPDPKENR